MFEALKRFFHPPAPDGGGDGGHDVRVAACALLLEIGRIDGGMTPAEMAVTVEWMEAHYGLEKAQAEALVAEAEAQLADSIDYWQFARLINEHYSIEEKLAIVEIMWSVVYVDGRLNMHEDHLMHKLSKTEPTKSVWAMAGSNSRSLAIGSASLLSRANRSSCERVIPAPPLPAGQVHFRKMHRLSRS